MRTLLCVALLLAVASAALPKWHQLDGYNFAAYVRDFQKTYASEEEYLQRQELFESSLKEVLQHNAEESHTYRKGINHLSDRTKEEYRRLLGYKRTTPRVASPASVRMAPLTISALPTNVDWRLKNVVTPVKDQGHCGSCWTFATAETVESFHAIKTGQLLELSEQQILDCTPNPKHCGGTGGCSGGTAELAFARIIELGGLTSEWRYGYTSYNGSDFACKINNKTLVASAKINSFKALPVNEYEPLINAVATIGPIAISGDASDWRHYESGVFSGCNATEIDINHAIQLVGYGTDEKLGDYYLVRNSWSPVWGEAGYIRIKRTSEVACGIDHTPSDGSGCEGGPSQVTVCGPCGLLYDTSYPL